MSGNKGDYDWEFLTRMLLKTMYSSILLKDETVNNSCNK